MIECHLKGLQGTYKARSRVGLGKGSHSTSQRVVEALAETCAKPKRTYGLCTRLDKGVPGYRQSGQPICASMRAGVPRSTTRTDRDPLPPTPHGSGRGSYPIFPVFFLEDIFVFNQGVV
jgi:hypothetical protein